MRSSVQQRLRPAGRPGLYGQVTPCASASYAGASHGHAERVDASRWRSATRPAARVDAEAIADTLIAPPRVAMPGEIEGRSDAPDTASSSRMAARRCNRPLSASRSCRRADADRATSASRRCLMDIRVAWAPISVAECSLPPIR
jgi:hypothetical protein